MWIPLLLVAQITLPIPSGPPVFDGPVSMNIAAVTGGYDYDLRGVEADTSQPGKEVLVYLPTLWAFSVGRWHQTKHGVGGQLPGAGLCVEPWTPILAHGPVWHFNTDADFTGDGLDDFVVYLQDGTVDLYTGRGLQVCR